MASWKKVIVSGSDAHLNHITASGNIEVIGNISGSSTSTGSFGKLLGDGSQLTNVASPFTSAGISGSFTDASSSLAGRITTEEGNVDTLQGRTLTAGTGLTGGGTLASDRTFNVVGGTGITANANDIATNDSEIVHDNLSGFVANEHIDHSSVSVTAGTGLTGGGTIAANRTLNVIGGDGITANANDIAITAAQTTIESIYKADLVIGEDAQTKIDFETSNEIHFDVNNKELLNLTGDIVSGSAASTGSFGRLQATTIGGNNPLNIENPTLVGDTEVQGNFNVTGDITAQNYIVSSSVTNIEYQSLSGSTIFGDTQDDTHQITGSVFITGSTTISERLTATEIGAFKATGAINFDSQNMTNVDINSGTINGITDLAVADGGTGVSTLTDGGVLLGNGTGGIVAMSVLTNGQFIVGDGTTDPVAESGDTARISMGVGSTSTWQITGLNVGHATDTTVTRASAGNLNIEGNIVYRAGGTDVPITDGGTGASNSNAWLNSRITTSADGTLNYDATSAVAVNHDSLAGFVGNEHIDHTSVSITAGTGLTGGGTIASTKTLNVIGGDGITANANDIAITPAQTTIASIYKADLVIGEDAQTKIDFETANEIHFDVNNSELLNLTGNKISGSSTSTGSFGSLVVSDKVQGDLTIGGNLIIEGDTVQQQVANLNIEDRFILLNSGSAAGDGGLIVQTEANFSGVVLGYDDSESRWGFQQGTKLSATDSVLAPDAYASAVVTSDDANYQKNGNIRVQSGEIYIYVE